MLLLFIICFDNVDCDIYNVFYCLYIECEINLSILQKWFNSLLTRLLLHFVPVFIQPIFMTYQPCKCDKDVLNFRKSCAIILQSNYDIEKNHYVEIFSVNMLLIMGLRHDRPLVPRCLLRYDVSVRLKVTRRL